jgi:hypothetical protein
MQPTRILRWALAVWVCGASFGAVQAAVDPLTVDQAERLLAEGRAVDALTTLGDVVVASESDTRVLYLVALAALDSAAPRRAVDALTRILSIEPRLDGARLDLARAQQAAGDRSGAERTLSALIESAASPVVRETARERLATLGPRGAAPRAWRWVPAVIAGVGHDSNTNASTTDREFFGFSLTPQAIAQDSAFADVGASLSAERAVGSGGWALNARAGHRSHPSAHFIDQSTVVASAAYSRVVAGWLGSLSVAGSAGWLDRRMHLGTGHVEASVVRRFARHWEIAALARAGFNDYRQPFFQEIDSRRFLWGAALQRLDLGSARARVGLALIGGRDDASRTESPWSNDRYGARLFGAVQPVSDLTWFGEASWLTSDYFGARGFFGVDRLDRQVVALLGVEKRGWPVEGWTWAPQVRWTDNPSNVALYEFDRLEWSLFLRREFR